MLDWIALAAAISVPLVSILLVIYMGCAVAVALFHSDCRRRRDARAVLGCLLGGCRRGRDVAPARGMALHEERSDATGEVR